MLVAIVAVFGWLLAGGPAPALAAGTVTIADAPDPSSQRLQFTAGAGDTNNVTFNRTGLTVFTVTDAAP